MPADALRFEPMADGVRQRVDDWGTAAIQFSPATRNEDVLEAGRVYFFTDRRRPCFVEARRAYERVVRWLKRWVETDQFRYRVGPAAAAAVRAGRLRLRSGVYALGARREPRMSAA